MRVELASYEFQCIKDNPQASQGLTHLPISGGQLIQSFGFEQLGFLHPIQRKAIQGCGIVLGATHPEELAFPAFV